MAGFFSVGKIILLLLSPVVGDVMNDVWFKELLDEFELVKFDCEELDDSFGLLLEDEDEEAAVVSE